MGTTVLDEILETTRELDSASVSAHELGERMATNELLDVVRHRELLEALADEPLDRNDLEARLGVSRATSHRFTRWLEALAPTLTETTTSRGGSTIGSR